MSSSEVMSMINQALTAMGGGIAAVFAVLMVFYIVLKVLGSVGKEQKE